MKTLNVLLALMMSFSLGIGSAGAQSRVFTFKNPKVTVFLPPKGMENGKAVVACPGGGYSHLAKDHEGFYWAPYFNDLGYAYAVVEYVLPDGDRTKPMNDVKRAFKILSDSAQVWKISPDKIGIMGSSAGGHLASTMATHPSDECRPAFQILFYPVISLYTDVTHDGTRNGFLGENPSDELVEQWSSDRQVSGTTPPAFIALSSDDIGVRPANSLLYFNALREAGVPVGMYIYPTGGHGWGYHTSFKYHDQLLSNLTDWLNTYAN